MFEGLGFSLWFTDLGLYFTCIVRVVMKGFGA